MKRPTSTNTVNRLHELFARYVVVDTIVTDNGTQFTSKEFEHFCATFQVEHIRIPPYHPRSNGQTKRFVDTLKRALKKAIGTPTKKALQLFQLSHLQKACLLEETDLYLINLFLARKATSLPSLFLEGNLIKMIKYFTKITKII